MSASNKKQYLKGASKIQYDHHSIVFLVGGRTNFSAQPKTISARATQSYEKLNSLFHQHIDSFLVPDVANGVAWPPP